MAKTIRRVNRTKVRDPYKKASKVSRKASKNELKKMYKYS